VPFRRRASKTAFTMIELLIAISVIIILGGILIYAVSGVLRSAREHATKVQLENAVSLLSELSSTVHLNVASRPSYWYYGGVQFDPTTSANSTLLDFWHIPQVDASSGSPRPLPIVAPNSINDGTLGRDAAENMTVPLSSVGSTTVGGVNDAIADTVIVFQKLQLNSNVRASLAKLPSDKLYVVKNTSILGNTVPIPPILLDAWNNPIIFVPASGLQITINRRNPPNSPSNIVVTSPDKQPFFASAGPNGDFNSDTDTTDNVYSFEK
jgi:type II secretory pathway pseudopilin PulG